jgi:hypothetical protein
MGKQGEHKPIHVVRCRECSGYHRINLKKTLIGDGPAPDIPDSLINEAWKRCFSSEIKCPKTGDTFIPTEDDWLHLTEQEFRALAKHN